MAKQILIIGGGIAGLSAATELLHHGCGVTVIEAKERFGGRIHTILDDSYPIELGAEFLHGESESLSRVLHSAGLSTHPVQVRNQLLENGQFRSVNIWDKMSDILHRINPNEPDQSFHDFAKQLDPENRRLSTAFVEGFNAADARRISAHALLRSEYSAEHMKSMEQSRMDHGYSALVRHLEQEIRLKGGTLLNQTVVQAVHWHRGEVEVRMQRTQGSETAVGDAAIITLPLGVLKARSVAFNPPLTMKEEAINGLEFGNVFRITLVFRKQCWPEPEDFGFIQALEETIPTWWSDPRGPILTGWAGGPKANSLLKLSSKELQKVAMDVLARIFPACALGAQLVAVHTYDWSRDPHILGAYSYIPVNGLDLPKLLAAPVEDTLFFAGEATATDAQTGTVFAAFDSGMRAAGETLELSTNRICEPSSAR